LAQVLLRSFWRGCFDAALAAVVLPRSFLVRTFGARPPLVLKRETCVVAGAFRPLAGPLSRLISKAGIEVTIEIFSAEDKEPDVL
jgi:hypothetical protein